MGKLLQTAARTLLLPILIATLNLAAAGEKDNVHTWTVKNGDTLKADFVRLEKDAVVLRTPGGTVKKAKIRHLIPRDQTRAKKLALEKKKQETSSGERSALAKKIRNFLGPKLVKRNKKRVSVDKLAGKKVALYFSAHWCPPCRQFTPKLVQTYQRWQQKEADIEIVFVSFDHGRKKMYKYMNGEQMPWLAKPYNKRENKKLANKLNVSGIPSLIVFDTNGEIITSQGRAHVSRHGVKALQKWNR